jgi:hypothetical protein
MNNLKKALLSILMALPLSTFAHGEEVIYILLVPVIATILILIAMMFVKLPKVTKGILVVTYIISVIIIFSLVSNLPYVENELLIKMLIVFVPIGFVIGMYYIIKAVKAEG